jgi:hypothetical protein
LWSVRSNLNLTQGIAFRWTSGCPWPKATVKPPVWNPGPKIEIPHPENSGNRRFPERTAVAVPVLVRLSRKEWRVGPTDGQTSEFIYKIWESNDTTLLNVDGRTLFFFPGHVISDSCEQGSHLPVLRTIDRLLLDQVQCEPAATNAPVGCYVQKVWNTKTQR